MRELTEEGYHYGMRSGIVAVLVTTLAASASADPPPPAGAPKPQRTPTAAPGAQRTTPVAPNSQATPAVDPQPQPQPQPLSRTPTVQPFLVFDPPPPAVPSLRLEALRIAGERADNDWRYPEPGPIFGFQDGLWYMGYGVYRPRTKRSAALHGGSMAATFLGEILLESGSPAAGVGMLLTGATLDAAAADVDRDAEARRKH